MEDRLTPFLDFSRDQLYELIKNQLIEVVDIDSIGDKEEKAPSVHQKRVDYMTEKEAIILEYLCPYNLSSIPPSGRAFKAYRDSFLMYLSSRENFQYHFKYFKEVEKDFEDGITKMSVFLNCVVDEIKNLNETPTDQPYRIVFEDVLIIYIIGSVIDAEIDYTQFNKIFCIPDNHYRYHIDITRDDSTVMEQYRIIYSGNLDKNGANQLSAVFAKIADRTESIIRCRPLLTHGHEPI